MNWAIGDMVSLLGIWRIKGSGGLKSQSVILKILAFAIKNVFGCRMVRIAGACLNIPSPPSAVNKNTDPGTLLSIKKLIYKLADDLAG